MSLFSYSERPETGKVALMISICAFIISLALLSIICIINIMFCAHLDIMCCTIKALTLYNNTLPASLKFSNSTNSTCCLWYGVKSYICGRQKNWFNYCSKIYDFFQYEILLRVHQEVNHDDDNQFNLLMEGFLQVLALTTGSLLLYTCQISSFFTLVNIMVHALHFTCSPPGVNSLHLHLLWLQFH